MGATPVWTIVVVVIVSFLAAIGQLLFKLGAASVTLTLWSWFLNWRLIAGLSCDGVGFVLLVIALKHGDLSILYPVLAISYVWVALLSVRFLGEPFSAAQWLGMGLIIGGIGLVVRKGMTAKASRARDQRVRPYTTRNQSSGVELGALTAAHNYYRSILAHFAPYVGHRVVEVGAGIGTFSDFLLKHTEASELTLIEPADRLFPVLQSRFSRQTRVNTLHARLEDLHGPLAADSVVLVNVLEHVVDEDALLQAAHRILVPDGALLIFVPALPCLFGTLDANFGHRRRYTKPSLRRRVLQAGLRLVRLRYFNLPGVASWFFAGRVLRRRTLRPQEVRLYERWIVPWISRLERRWEPPVGQSLIAVALK